MWEIRRYVRDVVIAKIILHRKQVGTSAASVNEHLHGRQQYQAGEIGDGGEQSRVRRRYLGGTHERGLGPTTTSMTTSTAGCSATRSVIRTRVFAEGDGTGMR